MWPVPLHVLKGVQESQFPGEAEDRRVGSGRCLHHMCPPRDSGDPVVTLESLCWRQTEWSVCGVSVTLSVPQSDAPWAVQALLQEVEPPFLWR